MNQLLVGGVGDRTPCTFCVQQWAQTHYSFLGQNGELLQIVCCRRCRRLARGLKGKTVAERIAAVRKILRRRRLWLSSDQMQEARMREALQERLWRRQQAERLKEQGAPASENRLT